MAFSTLALLVVEQPSLIGQELVPGEVARMGVTFKKAPLVARQDLHVLLAVNVFP